MEAPSISTPLPSTSLLTHPFLLFPLFLPLNFLAGKNGRRRHCCRTHLHLHLLPRIHILSRRRQNPRRLLRRRLADRPRHLLRRQRRLRHHGRRVRLRQPVQPGIRREQRGAEHGAVQQRPELRRVLRDQVRRRPVVPSRKSVHLHHGHQFLPAKLRPAQRQRRLVQPSAAAFRPRDADVPPHCRVPRRNCPGDLSPSAMQETRRDKVHNQRPPLLQPGFGHQRRGCREYREPERERHAHWVDPDEQKLGAKLANQRKPCGPASVLPRQIKRPPQLHLLEHRSDQLAVRTNLRRQELPRLNDQNTLQRHFLTFFCDTFSLWCSSLVTKWWW